jgi:hypothetical protein
MWKVEFNLNKGTTNYKFLVSMQFKKSFFCQIHLQCTSMEYGTYEIYHGKAQKKINQRKNEKIMDEKLQITN